MYEVFFSCFFDGVYVCVYLRNLHRVLFFFGNGGFLVLNRVDGCLVIVMVCVLCLL